MNGRTFAGLVGIGLVALLGSLSMQLPDLRQGLADEPPEGAKAAPPADVAILDIGKVFKQHLQFKKRMDELKARMEDFQAKTKTKQEEIQGLAERAKGTLKKGTEAFEAEDRRLQRMANELQAEVTAMQQELMKDEATAYAEIYGDVTKQVSAYARAKKIRLVLRFNSDPIDPTDRNSVLTGVNNAIVFQDQLDITEEIIRRVNAIPEKS